MRVVCSIESNHNLHLVVPVPSVISHCYYHTQLDKRTKYDTNWRLITLVSNGKAASYVLEITFVV